MNMVLCAEVLASMDSYKSDYNLSDHFSFITSTPSTCLELNVSLL